jgi:hypothetical protein
LLDPYLKRRYEMANGGFVNNNIKTLFGAVFEEVSKKICLKLFLYFFIVFYVKNSFFKIYIYIDIDILF